MANPKVIEQIKEMLPSNADVSSIGFEAANIVIYTKNKDFFLDNNGKIREIVDTIKKRVELRMDPASVMDLEDAEKIIRQIVTQESGEINVIFDSQRSKVIVEAEKPGVAIGKAGENLREIKEKTLWSATVRRIPSIRSKLIENIRQVLYENNDYRKKFLHKVGERIYGGKIRTGKTDWVRITCLGASREVGRSCFLLQTPESRILLDCGINVAAQGDDRSPVFEIPEFDIANIDAVVLSHAHLDHCALVPLLFKYGYRGPVYCTAPTRDVSALLCLDLIGINQKDAGKELYSSSDIKEMVKHTICIDYEVVTDITPDVRLTFYNAGHNLGSALSHFHIGDGMHNFLYTGDMNYELSNLLPPAVTKFPRLETVMMEATYGAKEDILGSRQESEEYLFNIVKETIGRGGKVLMPVLGVGRSQEIMLILERAMKEGRLEKVPIYIQGMVWDATAIHTAYPDFFNHKVKQVIFHKDENPFLSDIFKKVGSQKEMQELIEEKGACIIMATSGMLTGGASVEYFKALADDKRHSLVLTSYQGEGSLGRRLQNGEREIVFQEGPKANVVNVKMDIYSIHAFTGHSDRLRLMNWVRKLTPKPKKLMTIHGEASKCVEFASAVHKEHRIETLAPKVVETIRLR